ncbi:MAG TPA: coenzyme F430 synthase [Candidatus Bathyarchaeia archaeon]|nr:coenzyme F430 synthase [Candidatus Bathyarchaeia archaeon]
MDFSGKNIAVLDTIHGARQICKTLREVGADAVAINIYHDTPPPTTIDSFDAVIAPVHAYSVLKARAEASGIPVLTHHQAVGQLARQIGAFQDALIFEVTGVKGKTTTASLLELAFSDRKVLSLTSRGLEIHKNGACVAKKRLSITPANILAAADVARELDFEPQVCIFEVSLGGTGLADVNVITTLSPEYSIARETSTSTAAKLQMLSNAKAGSCVVTPGIAASFADSCQCLNTFGEEGATVRYEDLDTDKVTIAFNDLSQINGQRLSGQIQFKPAGGYDLTSYEDTLLCFVTTALSAKLDPETIAHKLSIFKGVIGRMSSAVIENRVLIDNSNSGLDPTSVERAIRYGVALKEPGQKVVLIIGAETKAVCEGIDVEIFETLSRDSVLDAVVIVGDQMWASRTNVLAADDLESALLTAITLTKERDVIISCVKVWR